MAYAYSDNAKFQGAALGNAVNTPVARTISSAASRIDALNERLSKACEGLSMVCAQIGALTPVSSEDPVKGLATSNSGAVHRLNDSADEAHAKLSDIDNYIGSLQRALG